MYSVVMGDRGRLVIPAELRDRLHVQAGSPLVMLDTPLAARRRLAATEAPL